MNDFIEQQLAVWPEARERYLALGKTERRKFKVRDFEGAFQFNPARIVSTAARTDAASVAARPCFLCRENRPKEQTAIPLNPNWEMTINPYPIFPVHFTIISTKHVPQDTPPLEMAGIAEHFPDLCIFFNGASGGASAPDHSHMQAVLKSELPILRLAEEHHPDTLPGIMRSDMWTVKDESGEERPINLPFVFLSAVITDDEEGGHDYLKMLALTGAGADGKPDKGLRNVFCWKGESGLLRMIVVPRSQHRPECYGTGENQLLVAPGAIDMAGVVILPRKEDFETITPSRLNSIYADVT